MSETSELGSGLSCESETVLSSPKLVAETPAADKIEVDSGLFSNSFSHKEASVLFHQ